MGKDTGEIREEIERTRERMGDTVDAIAYKADVPSRMQDAVSDRVDSLKHAVTGRVGNMRETVSNALPDAGVVRDRAMGAVDGLRANPLGLFFGTMAVGFLIGSLIPGTDLENERLGDVGDSIKEKARTAGSQAMEHGKAVVRETLDAAKQSAEEHAQQLSEATTNAGSPAQGAL